jgi:hypothetical protein
VISVRIPTAINTKLVELRRRAWLLGFNFNATQAGILSEGANRIREELDDEERKLGRRTGEALTNGAVNLN